MNQNKDSYFSKFNLLIGFFGGMIISGAILLPSVVYFEQLQTLFFVYLGFSLMIIGGIVLSILAVKQDKLREVLK